MQVKGLEMPPQEPRFAKGFDLGHATSNRSADHLYAIPAIDLGGNWDVARKIFTAEILDGLMDPANETYKPDMVMYGEHYNAIQVHWTFASSALPKNTARCRLTCCLV